MRLKFKVQPYQTQAVESLVDCFLGQPPKQGRTSYRIDPGRIDETPKASQGDFFPLKEVPKPETGFNNGEIALTSAQLLENIQAVQRSQNLPLSKALVTDKLTGSPLNLDVEMETGTGKTYCYIKSMFELNKRYGWSKFIVVVPSIAIREGVYKSLQIIADHFLEGYGKKARFFVYNSKQLHNLENFSSDAGINVMVINVQAFTSTSKDNRRIYDELDDFQSRRPIDVIKANRPILILDEPQKMEGKKTLTSISEFNPLFILRYSATHRTEYNKIHRLGALDAYNQRLVKKIAVRGITVKGLTGTNAYLYLEGIEIAKGKPPVARLELEIKQGGGIKRVLRKVGHNDNLFDLSNGLDQYKGFVVAEIDARINTLSFTNGVELVAGEAHGNVDESAMRRIQIREAIKAHFNKEQVLFQQGIKVLSLFFIDEVARYRQYDEEGEQPGEYARIFEEEYNACFNEVASLVDSDYNRYLKGIDTARTHAGYFSIDKKSKRLLDPKVGKRASEADDVDAYDLILRDKERLLSLNEPVRFIFSHSALHEGWDNPNVFVICTLKHSDNTISRRQEVGRGLRLAVNQLGDRNTKVNPLNTTNFERKEFQALWNRINRKAAYTVRFESDELVEKCVAALDHKPDVKRMQYVIERGEQKAETSFEEIRKGEGFRIAENETEDYNHPDQRAEGHRHHRAYHLRPAERLPRLRDLHQAEAQGRFPQGLPGPEPHLRLRLYRLQSGAGVC
jgi:type III restriction enzyme